MVTIPLKIVSNSLIPKRSGLSTPRKPFFLPSLLSSFLQNLKSMVLNYFSNDDLQQLQITSQTTLQFQWTSKHDEQFINQSCNEYEGGSLSVSLSLSSSNFSITAAQVSIDQVEYTGTWKFHYHFLPHIQWRIDRNDNFVIFLNDKIPNWVERGRFEQVWLKQWNLHMIAPPLYSSEDLDKKQEFKIFFDMPSVMCSELLNYSQTIICEPLKPNANKCIFLNERFFLKCASPDSICLQLESNSTVTVTVNLIANKMYIEFNNTPLFVAKSLASKWHLQDLLSILESAPFENSTIGNSNTGSVYSLKFESISSKNQLLNVVSKQQVLSFEKHGPISKGDHLSIDICVTGEHTSVQRSNYAIEFKFNQHGRQFDRLCYSLKTMRVTVKDFFRFWCINSDEMQDEEFQSANISIIMGNHFFNVKHMEYLCTATILAKKYFIAVHYPLGRVFIKSQQGMQVLGLTCDALVQCQKYDFSNNKFANVKIQFNA